MTTNYPGSLDSYTTKVDNVDDVMAAHVNNLQDAVVALETYARAMDLRVINNGSGSTATANQVGYIDEAGDFQYTTTEFDDDVDPCVVIVGAANGSDIIVAIGGSPVTVELNGNCSAGDYLYFSTTSGRAEPQTYVRPGLLAIALTANSSGAGGTCDAILYFARKEVLIASDYNMIYIDASTGTDWQTTQNGAVAGAVVTYNVALTNGTEDAIVPQATNELFKLVLHNVTQGEEAYISSVNIGANTITVTDASDIVGWADTNVLEVRSQTNTDTQAGLYWFDLYTASSEIPPLTVGINFAVHLFLDTGGTGEAIRPHPWEAGSTSKRQLVNNTLTTSSGGVGQVLKMPLIQRRFCIHHTASGAGTASMQLRIRSAIVASPS